MKTKLLKKVRKRYVIQYKSKQATYYDKTFYGQSMVIWDRQEDYSLRGVEICFPDKYQKFFDAHRPTKELARLLLLDTLMNWIREDYKHTRKRVPKQIIERIWYK